MSEAPPPSTIKEALALAERQRIGSNLLNLATAHSRIGEENTRLRAKLARNEAIQAEIEALDSRDPATITLEETKDLYDRSYDYKKRDY